MLSLAKQKVPDLQCYSLATVPSEFPFRLRLILKELPNLPIILCFLTGVPISEFPIMGIISSFFTVTSPLSGRLSLPPAFVSGSLPSHPPHSQPPLWTSISSCIIIAPTLQLLNKLRHSAGPVQWNCPLSLSWVTFHHHSVSQKGQSPPSLLCGCWGGGGEHGQEYSSVLMRPLSSKINPVHHRLRQAPPTPVLRPPCGSAQVQFRGRPQQKPQGEGSDQIRGP